MKILVVEDTKMMAKAIIELLENLGHDVSWVIGYNDPSTLACLAEDGSEVMLNATDYDLVFMDGDLEAGALGTELVPGFAEAGVPCFGTSTMPKMNEEMIEVGAVGAAGKATFLLALVHNRVTAEEFAECTDETNEALASVESEAKACDQFRKAGDSLLRKHI